MDERADFAISDSAGPEDGVRAPSRIWGLGDDARDYQEVMLPDGGLAVHQRYVTGRKNAEAALSRAQRELAHGARLATMGELVAWIAHEVNQPLGAIINNGIACERLLAGVPGVPQESETTGTEAEAKYKQLYPKGRKATVLGAGAVAPDFRLKTTPDQAVSLSEFRGQPVVLAFYPADWSPVCGDQMALYNEILPEFQDLGAELMGISVDGVWCHAAFARDRKLHFPLLSDFEPKGEMARSYGVYRESDGVSERALFVIDGEGIIRWSYVSPIGVNPGAAGILAALEDLQKPKPEVAQ